MLSIVFDKISTFFLICGSKLKISSVSTHSFPFLEQSLARWREVLRARLVLLPPEAAFYTANMSALPGLDEKKARPLPPEEAARLFPASVNAGWSFTFVIPDESCAETRLISGQNPAGK